MLEQIIAAMIAQGYTIYSRPYELNILGIRNNSSVPNTFDDVISAIYRDEQNKWQVRAFHATTDPGVFWLKNPANPQGTAILKAGQYIGSHMIGLHRGQYTALVQKNPVTVIRDAKRDGTFDFGGTAYTGMFGINIHRASVSGTTKFIDKYSAGCQVFANANDFAEFINLCQRHRQLYGNSFTYTLVDQSHIFDLKA